MRLLKNHIDRAAWSRLCVALLLLLSMTTLQAANLSDSVLQKEGEEERVGGIGGTGIQRQMERPERLERPEPGLEIERPERPESGSDFELPDLDAPEGNAAPEIPEKP
jgi:hypothetical protein